MAAYFATYVVVCRCRWTRVCEDDDFGASGRGGATQAPQAAQAHLVTTVGKDFTRDHEISDRARQIDTYLWMSGPDAPWPENPSQLSDLAGCFEAVACTAL